MDKKKMDPVYLIKVDPTWNNNKYYEMSDNYDGTWTARYGRIGDKENKMFGERTTVYPSYQWYIKYQEKLSKGYKDISKVHYGKGVSDVAIQSNGYAPIEDPEINAFINMLMERSRQIVKKNYTVKTEEISEEMLDEGKSYIDKLRKARKKETFNKYLVELFTVIPRRMEKVDQYIATSKDDFQRIIDREQDLFDILKGQVKISTQKTEKGQTILDAYGINMWPATKEQTDKVMEHLTPSLRPRVKHIWRVINKKTQDRFNEYLKKEHIKKVKELWHGSRTENWLSLMAYGMSLHPNAVNTGKMFGMGLYFAPDADKSFNYTSANGTSWAHGRDSVGIMGLFATAYGKPYVVHTYAGYSGLTESSFKHKYPGHNCMHAKSDQGMLRKDEIIFYTEKALTLNYIVEFSSK